MNKLLIFGVGLIGGSLALALKRAQAVRQIVGIGRADDNLQAALALGVIDVATTNLPQALADADVVVIATPVAQIPLILAAIAPHLDPETIVTDVGSSKSDVIRHARQLLPGHFGRFVAGHPIAGAEKSGVTAAHADLFAGKNVVLTPAPETSPDALETVSRMWRSTGAHISQMDADTHDGIFAAVSHLPHLLAFALVDELSRRPNAAQLFDFAASGFRDFTRIAGSSPEMWRDISLANREALLSEVTAYQQALTQLHALLEKNDGPGLQALFERASEARNRWAQQAMPSKAS
ncbi:MAG TPA: prephenate dehydrogenase/arogenate dehydrogenase family protein [Methylophilaceae bacterium]|nr:prephenate dehydrogenase/arogenate dehydrogenase family protein [Methylophilaceae bacterium]